MTLKQRNGGCHALFLVYVLLLIVLYLLQHNRAYRGHGPPLGEIYWAS